MQSRPISSPNSQSIAGQGYFQSLLGGRRRGSCGLRAEKHLGATAAKLGTLALAVLLFELLEVDKVTDHFFGRDLVQQAQGPLK